MFAAISRQINSLTSSKTKKCCSQNIWITGLRYSAMVSVCILFSSCLNCHGNSMCVWISLLVDIWQQHLQCPGRNRVGVLSKVSPNHLNSLARKGWKYKIWHYSFNWNLKQNQLLSPAEQNRYIFNIDIWESKFSFCIVIHPRLTRLHDQVPMSIII